MCLMDTTHQPHSHLPVTGTDNADVEQAAHSGKRFSCASPRITTMSEFCVRIDTVHLFGEDSILVPEGKRFEHQVSVLVRHRPGPGIEVHGMRVHLHYGV